jgi:hypothetical protein
MAKKRMAKKVATMRMVRMPKCLEEAGYCSDNLAFQFAYTHAKLSHSKSLASTLRHSLIISRSFQSFGGQMDLFSHIHVSLKSTLPVERWVRLYHFVKSCVLRSGIFVLPSTPTSHLLLYTLNISTR